ncbi:hypothetical protein HYX58_01105 [Candidatus Dependentiae bacterium]|nr:hypothetical protein [Candidatus Dependentiae bacterium]
MNKIKIKIFVFIVFHLWGINTYAMEMKQDNDNSGNFQAYTSSPIKNSLAPAREYISPDHTLIGRVPLNDGETKIYDLNNKELATLGIVDNLSFSPANNYVGYTLFNKKYKSVSFNIADAPTGQIVYETKDGKVIGSRPVFKNSSNILFGVPPEIKTCKLLIVRLSETGIAYKMLNITNSLFFGERSNKELVVFNNTSASVDIIDYDGDIKKSIKALAFPSFSADSMKISRDGKAVAWASQLKVFCIADLEKGSQVVIFAPEAKDLTFSSDNDCLAVTDAQRISFFESSTGNVRYFFDYANLKHFDSNGLGFSKVSWNDKSLLIHFVLGTWIKTDAQKIKAFICPKDENLKKT